MTQSPTGADLRESIRRLCAEGMCEGMANFDGRVASAMANDGWGDVADKILALISPLPQVEDGWLQDFSDDTHTLMDFAHGDRALEWSEGDRKSYLADLERLIAIARAAGGKQ